MSITTAIQDGLANVMSRMGTGKDKASHTHYAPEYITDYELTNAYRHSWLARKIVDIPAEDATRKWRVWDADPDEADRIEHLEARLDLQNKIRRAMQRARLYGIGYLYIGTNRNPSKPLDVTREELRHITIMNRDDLQIESIERDTTKPNFGQPRMYRSGHGSTLIHPTRVVKLVERESMSQFDSHDEAGDSVLLAAWDAIKNADSTAANVASLVFESKIDVFRIPELRQMCQSAQGEEDLFRRLMVANMGKSNHNALVLDENEGFEQKTQSFGSLNDIMLSQYQLAAGAAHIPVTRLIGQASSGLNNTGDREIREYYDEVQSTQNLTIGPALYFLDELIIHNALGYRPDSVGYSWCSLWQLDEQQQAEIAEKNSKTIQNLVDSDVFPVDALQQPAIEMLEKSGAMPGIKSAVDDYYNGE